MLSYVKNLYHKKTLQMQTYGFSHRRFLAFFVLHSFDLNLNKDGALF